MEILKPGETATLKLAATDGPASSWRAIPDGLVTLTPADDGMSCTATAAAGQVGTCTVKAFDNAGKNAVGYFSLQLVPPAPAPRKPAQIRPTPPAAVLPASPAPATTSPATAASGSIQAAPTPATTPATPPA